MSDFVELGNGPAPMRVTLVDGRDNALSLERRDDTGPVAWPSAPTLRLRDAAGVVVFDAAGVLSNSDSVASWTVPDAVVSLGTTRPVRGQIVLDGVVVFAGTVVVLDGWSGVCPSVDVGGASVVVGPPGPEGPPGDIQPFELLAAQANVWNVADPRWEIAGDGTKTDTAKINTLLVTAGEGATIVFPNHKALGLNRTWLVYGLGPDDAQPQDDSYYCWRGGGVTPLNGQTIVVEHGATVKCAPSDRYANATIYIGPDIDGVRLTGGGTLSGDRLEHTYTALGETNRWGNVVTYEFGYVVALHACQNVTIDNLTIINGLGDGICTIPSGRLSTNNYKPVRNLTVRDCTISGSRRNNLSFTGDDKVTVSNCLIADAGQVDTAGNDGTAPRAGIDIESSNNSDQPTGKFVFDGNTFVNNKNQDISQYNGWETIITNNVCSNQVGYGFGHQTIIANNIIRAPGRATGEGISANYFVGMPYRMKTLIDGNMVEGFGTGIRTAAHDVLCTNNQVFGFADRGVFIYTGDTVVAQDNWVFAPADPAKTTTAGFALGGVAEVTITGGRVDGCYTGVSTWTGPNNRVTVNGLEVRNAARGLNLLNMTDAHTSNNDVRLGGHGSGEVVNGYEFNGPVVSVCDAVSGATGDGFKVTASSSKVELHKPVVSAYSGSTSPIRWIGGKLAITEASLNLNKTSGTTYGVVASGAVGGTISGTFGSVNTAEFTAAADLGDCTGTINMRGVALTSSTVFVGGGGATTLVPGAGSGGGGGGGALISGTHKWIPGRYYTPPAAAYTTASSNASQVGVFYVPLWVPTDAAIDRIGCEITTAGPSGSEVKMGIYSSGSNFDPLTLLAELPAPIDATSPGVKDVALSATLSVDAGLYWIAVGVNDAIGLRRISGALPPVTNGSTPVTWANVARNTYATYPVSFTLPATAPTFGSGSVGWAAIVYAPLVHARAA